MVTMVINFEEIEEIFSGVTRVGKSVLEDWKVFFKKEL